MTSTLARLPIIGKLFITAHRALLGWQTVKHPVGNYLRWIFTSNETTNFTYHLTNKNLGYLTCFVAEVSGCTHAQAKAYIQELEFNTALKQHILSIIATSDERHKADKEVRFARRLGWYAFVRALKPRIVIETGVDKGLGACVITAALQKNAEEGHSGYYYGTDINPKAGYLLTGEYSKYGEILYGDSIESLQRFQGEVDIFINDSDHSAEYEAREYEVIESKLSKNALIIGDNGDATTKLMEYALKTNRSFLYFTEEPEEHWWPGGGIGVAWRKK